MKRRLAGWVGRSGRSRPFGRRGRRRAAKSGFDQTSPMEGVHATWGAGHKQKQIRMMGGNRHLCSFTHTHTSLSTCYGMWAASTTPHIPVLLQAPLLLLRTGPANHIDATHPSRRACVCTTGRQTMIDRLRPNHDTFTLASSRLIHRVGDGSAAAAAPWKRQQ